MTRMQRIYADQTGIRSAVIRCICVIRVPIGRAVIPEPYQTIQVQQSLPSTHRNGKINLRSRSRVPKGHIRERSAYRERKRTFLGGRRLIVAQSSPFLRSSS